MKTCKRYQYAKWVINLIRAELINDPVTGCIELLEGMTPIGTSNYSAIKGLVSTKLFLNKFRGIELVADNNTSVGSYISISDEAAEILIDYSEKSRVMTEFTTVIVAINISGGRPLPKQLREWASKRIVYWFTGMKKPPSIKSFPKDFYRRYTIYLAIHVVADIYSLPISRNDGSPEHSACDVVSDALDKMGLQYSYSRLRDWCTHSDHKLFRDYCSDMIDFVAEGDPDALKTFRSL
ncbi:hypothetical protein [Loktanella sp. SALINAS62]|uniref:hypothetical protein n=1 Tax=Loktanella sp. SALINAS62 TaxID=2706124 RepID=UPI001B8BB812|nr:hypothetical protein [Loktanella sp. SALINAS62]MBS1300772.1 hypothetical protein [Loktanella sp. SALINAS62]